MVTHHGTSNPAAQHDISNNAFHALHARLITAKQSRADATKLARTLEERLEAARAAVQEADTELSHTEQALIELRPRLHFSSELPDCVALSIMAGLSQRGGGLAMMACRRFRNIVERARALGLYSNPIRSVGACQSHTVVCMDDGV